MNLNLLKKIVWKTTSPRIGLKFNKLIHRFDEMPSHFIETKSIFIHIPKAAGLSLVESIYGLKSSNHNTWIDYYNLNKEMFDEYYKYSITREPSSRLKSAYSYLKAGGRTEVDQYWKKNYIDGYETLTDFINFGLSIAIKDEVEHFIPQYKFIYNQDHDLMVDFVGKYENIENDFKTITSKIPTRYELTKTNQQKQYSHQISSEDLDIIKEFYKTDYELLGY